MGKYRIQELQNPERYLVTQRHWLLPLCWRPMTFGDGCGNDTGIEVVYSTLKEAEDYIERSERFDKWYRGL